jgi:hypothetical protein
MKKQLILTALCLSACAIQAAQLDLAGVLFTEDGIRPIPVSLYYSEEPDGPVPVNSVILQMPFQYDQQTGYDPTSFGWDPWPELTFDGGIPVSLRFTSINPFPGIWRLGVGGLLSWNNQYGDEIVEGWSIPAFLDLPTVRVGLASSPAPAGLLTPIPEPGHYALLAGLALMGFVAIRRRI